MYVYVPRNSGQIGAINMDGLFKNKWNFAEGLAQQQDTTLKTVLRICDCFDKPIRMAGQSSIDGGSASDAYIAPFVAIGCDE